MPVQQLSLWWGHPGKELRADGLGNTAPLEGTSSVGFQLSLKQTRRTHLVEG